MSGSHKSSARKGKRFTEADLLTLKANIAAASGDLAAANGGAPAKKAKRRKYNNEPTYVGTIKFASGKEARRYQALRQLEIAGVIRDLRLQVPFVLAESVDLGEKRRKRAMKYIADFVYIDAATGEQVVEDVKGVQTRQYRDRKHLMKSVHGITIREV